MKPDLIVIDLGYWDFAERLLRDVLRPGLEWLGGKPGEAQLAQSFTEMIAEPLQK